MKKTKENTHLKAYAIRISIILVTIFLFVLLPILNAFHVAADEGLETPIIQNEAPLEEAPAEEEPSPDPIVPDEEQPDETLPDHSSSVSSPEEDTNDTLLDPSEEPSSTIIAEEPEDETLEDEEVERDLLLYPTPATLQLRASTAEPAHRKYITPAGDGTYNLSLEVTGNNQTEEHPANVIIIFDVSGSTTPMMLASFKLAARSLADILLTPENANLPPEKQVRISIVTFSETARVHGEFTSDRSVFESYINSIASHGSEVQTNWQDTLWYTDTLLTRASEAYPNAKKYALFLTDGGPNIQYPGYSNYVESENRATILIRNGVSLYTIGVLDNNNQGNTIMPYVRMDAAEGEGFLASDYSLSYSSGYELATNALTIRAYKFAGAPSLAAGKYFIVDKNTNQEYINAFKNISNEISESMRYTNITITDTLSAYVDLVNAVDGAGNIRNCTVEKVFNGTSTPINNYSVTYNAVTKQITFKINEELDHQSVYRLTFQVTPSQQAFDELAFNRETNKYPSANGFPHIGGTDTGTTSENQNGFYSNDNATISFQTINGTGSLSSIQTGTPFEKPVVQVELGSIHVTKIWKDDVPSDRPLTIDIVLMQDDDFFVAIAITASDNWEFTFINVPGGPEGHEYTLLELPVENYNTTYTPSTIVYKGLLPRTLEFSIINTPDGTRTTDLSFSKISSTYYANGQPTNDPLPNAVFSLYVWTGTGTPSPTALVTSSTISSGQWTLETTTTSMGDGTVQLPTQVKAGAYYQLVETASPANYHLPTGQWRFQLNAQNQIDPTTIQAILGADGTTPPPFKIMTDGPFAGQLALVNVPTYEMPAMGGNGTTKFIVGGVSLMSAAVFIYLHAEKRKRINKPKHI